MSAIEDIVSTLQGGVRNLGQLVQVLSAAFPRTTGSLTLSNATVTVVADTSVTTSSIVLWSPTNAAAGLLERSQGLYRASLSPGVSFTLSTQTGTAAGTETFDYVMINPA
jgi:hypothetical protein